MKLTTLPILSHATRIHLSFRFSVIRHATLAALILLFTPIFTPATAWSCACGCGIFDVGTYSMFPDEPGGMLYLNFDYQDQNRNWSGTSRAPAADNDDKKLRTYFVTTGIQYLFNRYWGVQLEVPYVNRTFKTIGDNGVDVVTARWNALGDIRLKGIYTGFSADMSTGLTFGLKLPTGEWRETHPGADIDRDSQVGSGSTDLLLGVFHHGNVTSDHHWRWFAQAELDLPMFIQDEYRPGIEIDAAAGIYYDGWTVGRAKVRPIAQLLFSERTHDSGTNSADPVASGYQRLLLSPGLEIDIHPVIIHADVEFPVFEHVTGNQLVAPALFKFTVGFHF